MDLLSYMMGKKAGGGGEIPIIESWDFTKSLTGEKRGYATTINSYAQRTDSGIVFNSVSAYAEVSAGFPQNVTLEIDVGQMNLAVSPHKRFIMAARQSGLIYRDNGKWSFYSSNRWATDSAITSGSFFENSTVKVYIDGNGYWHIYKNDELVYEPNAPFKLQDYKWWLGSSDGQSINNATIRGVRVY